MYALCVTIILINCSFRDMLLYNKISTLFMSFFLSLIEIFLCNASVETLQKQSKRLIENLQITTLKMKPWYFTQMFVNIYLVIPRCITEGGNIHVTIMRTSNLIYVVFVTKSPVSVWNYPLFSINILDVKLE
jgi:hypothetical protein